MPDFTAAAPGKIILFGEHAVVYGQPAIAVPVRQVSARAIVSPLPGGEPGRLHIQAPAIDLDAPLESLPPGDSLRLAVEAVQAALALSRLPACRLRITSTIPVAAGLGSGAAVSVAILRALSAFLGSPLSDEQVNRLAYEIEKVHHGTPSGIDNTVITYAMPVYFVRGQPIETFRVARPFSLVIADTGVPSPTAVTVGAVRQAWLADPAGCEPVFAAIGQITRQARQAIEAGENDRLGPLMDENHAWLQKLGVSSPELDRLVEAARQAGAAGAKLSGGGGGGNMIALAAEAQAETIAAALESAGATRCLTTRVAAPPAGS
jgi:mevalonate kinase